MARSRPQKSPARTPRRPKPQRDERASHLLAAVSSIRDYGIFLLDPEGCVLTWNQGAELTQGYKEKEIIGKHFSAFYTKADRDRRHPQAELKEAKKTGRYEEEGWRVRADGTHFWANVVITKLTDEKGQLIGFSKVTRDLSQRKAVMEELRSSEERFRLLVTSVKDYAIFMLDTEGRVASWNEGAQRIKGYAADEIIGKCFAIFYAPEEAKSGKSEYELAEATRTGRFEDEGWRVRKDGTQFWANVVVTAVRDGSGKLIGFAKITRDLTERRRAEDKIRLAYASLEKRVEERTEELKLANQRLAAREQELREAVRVRDEFLSIASHELKTPITSLRLQMQMLQTRMAPPRNESPSNERLVKFLNTGLSQVNRLTQLVEDLLDVARAGSRKLEFHFERTDLRALGTEVIERLKIQAEAAGCHIHCEAPEPVIGSFDRFRLDQLIVNLLTNAIKYAPGTNILFDVRARDDKVTILVKDGGPGVPLDAQARLFERFERGANAQNVGGLGLGLFITREIVNGHRGTIRLESAPGTGATFVVELPVSPGPTAEEAKARC